MTTEKTLKKKKIIKDIEIKALAVLARALVCVTWTEEMGTFQVSLFSDFQPPVSVPRSSAGPGS